MVLCAWGPANQQRLAFAYHYFTTASHNTTGTMSTKDGKSVTDELMTAARAV